MLTVDRLSHSQHYSGRCHKKSTAS